jgi:hypothetical protein
LVLKLFAPFGDGWTVQTHRPKVMLVKNVSQTDHGKITVAEENRLCRSAARFNPVRNPQVWRVIVTQITVIL